MDRNKYIDDYGLQIDPLFDNVDALEAEIAELRKAPTDSGVLESDLLCKKFNDGEIDLCALVCRLWNTALALEKSDE